MQLLLPTERNVGNPTLGARWEASMQVAEQTPEVRDTAVAVISALGFCRIYGITLPLDLKTPLTSPLPVELLAPAIAGMLHMLESATDDARTLPARFDNSEPLEDRSHCTSILHSLMELWAMYIVVDDEYQHNLNEGSDNFFNALMHQLLAAFSSLDAEVQRDEQKHLLSIATELPLLDNWRKMLAEPYCEHLPWWLDGTLEEAAVEVRRSVLSVGILDDPENAKYLVRDISTSHTAFSYAVDVEFAMAAAEGLSLAPEVGSEISQVANYLMENFIEILRHGNSKVWFELNPKGDVVGHTFAEEESHGFARKSGPHVIPVFFDLKNLLQSDFDRMNDWLLKDVKIGLETAKAVLAKFRSK
jgi:hypothetical protein